MFFLRYLGWVIEIVPVCLLFSKWLWCQACCGLFFCLFL